MKIITVSQNRASKTAQAKKPLKAYLITDENGDKVLWFPDQGIVKGCDKLSQITNTPIDHSGSNDWREELKRRYMPNADVTEQQAEETFDASPIKIEEP